jgi:hypothetical protein
MRTLTEQELFILDALPLLHRARQLVTMLSERDHIDSVIARGEALQAQIDRETLDPEE